ncbi:MAG: Lipoprotein signal peptidase [uncultured Friedmanniella sp.]|uniref:Lipoprotein signal peptidase n=1 Tax=uncultured Friedmanniella sp. TaxID=335381 RepID=A0A6J4K747_9ACTN|nr:signal peptidase II [uncultured Friedmanniella sp.]CAA9297514.1 MAG: Lipoprotein signal peptidase [uncultured Friedmanniella sp.]
MASRRRLRGLFAAVALVGLALYLVTKIVAVDRLRPGQPVPLVEGVLTLRLIRNPGAAFGTGGGITPVFALAACAVLVFVVVRLVPRLGHAAWAVALGLLCAGVGGNLVDRFFRAPGVLRGHVVDFLQLPHWPIFNVADICITSAAVLIMVLAVVKNIDVNGQRYTRDAAPASPAPTSVANDAPGREDHGA